MPNWVKNIVTVSEDTMNKIKEKYFTDGVLDFNKVVPMPKSLQLASGSITEMSIFYAFIKKDTKEQIEIAKLLKSTEDFIYKNYLNKIKHYYDLGHFKNIEEKAKNYTPEDVAKKLNIKTLEDLGNAYINNIKNYGCDTWYDWCINNWGTKWGVDSFQCNKTTMIFNTAWGTPEPIFAQLSKELPNKCIEVKYADECYSNYNNGTITYKNGMIDYETELDEDFATEVWDEEIKKEDEKDITDEMFD